ncbi:hypothetical protein AURDEDRAFT_36708, partial [Auricularia subglabra TFB-10046 SS5]
MPNSVSTRINVYWFLALSLSLSAALIAILCKQWIREFERNVGLTPRAYVDRRQMKFEGIRHWQLGVIIAALPLLLQLSLAMFALGVHELLWRLNPVVAIVVCIPTTAVLVFYAATTLLPSIQYFRSKGTHYPSLWQKVPQCPYKSPQA